MLWWFLPEIGKIVLWVSGSGNYLWTAVIDLLWFYLFIKEDLRINVLPFTVLLAHFACIYSLIASNEKPDRVFFGASILICLAVFS